MFVLTRTQFGRYVFAAGDNPEAARLSGINVNKIRTIAFGISGFASVGGRDFRLEIHESAERYGSRAGINRHA
jgi:ribose/xylose/arabinose/galactoside ABC-type transport system permease subunit